MLFSLKQTLLLLSLCPLLFSCNNDPKSTAAQSAAPAADAAQTASGEGELYTVTAGEITWAGVHVVDKSGHKGTISVSGGTLLVSNGKPVQGKVTIDMNSISVTDIKDPGERRDLESHLKDSDFFETNNFPQAEYYFGVSSPSTMPGFGWFLHGLLTMKGHTDPVDLPVNIKIDGETLRAESATVQINRTQWDVNFQSGILGTAKDKMIDDMVPISIKLTAKKK